MRSVIIAIAIAGLFATAAAADDATSPVAGKLPDNSRSHQLFLFSLKKNGLSIRMSPQKFCRDLGYGEPIKWSKDPKEVPDDVGKGSGDVKKDADDDKGFWEQARVVGEDGKTIERELVWVICEFVPPQNTRPVPKP
jgi:hypothetical protein